MQGFKSKVRVATVVILTAWVALAALYGLLKPISNGCVMTYMYPTYIPLPVPHNVSSARYGLYLYHEGWKKIDFNQRLKSLRGVPVLFIPGNGGSYKQVRSLAAESDRAYQGGPLERTYYHEAGLTVEEGGLNAGFAEFRLPNQYDHMLDWFTVDLEGEHSAMDSQILEEHTEYVVYAIHRILDQYKESHDAKVKEGAATSSNLPKSIILVGHSMGGFVARAAIVHPNLRKSAVETVLTLSSPHQSPPVALQPSLGNYYARINEKWKEGYKVQTSRAGSYVSDPVLSQIIVISISGGFLDYQVRPNLETIEGIVPPTRGFFITSSGMNNVWLSMEHQAILWCNQLVVQVSHTLLSLIESQTGQPFSSPQKRLAIFARMLRSGIPQGFDWQTQGRLPMQYIHNLNKDETAAAGFDLLSLSACPKNTDWSAEALEKDLYIETTTVTVLAMDGRRRWLDIEKLGAKKKGHFLFVTNLAPCSGVRLHLWPEKGKSNPNLPSSTKVFEVTSKMVRIPSGPAQRQIEPGSQTEQPPPTAVLWLCPKDMHGFKFLTISVAPRPTISGRPPPIASMAVGQFFDPKDGNKDLSFGKLLLSAYSQRDMLFKENHPLVFNMSFGISLGLLPITLSLRTVGCGIKISELPIEEAGDVESSRLCKLRCFPPVALAWDTTSGLHVFPNLYSETILVDSSPALWSSSEASDKTTILLIVDPHCSYKASISVSVTSAATRFLLSYSSEIIGFTVAVIFFALMRQAHSWDHDMEIPSVLAAVEMNLRAPFPFLLFAFVPIIISLIRSLIMSQPFPPFASFIAVSLIAYLCANGANIVLIMVSQVVFYVSAVIYVFFKSRRHWWEGYSSFIPLRWITSFCTAFYSLKMMRIVKANPLLLTTLVAIALVCFVHPAVGLSVLLLSHATSCHKALCSFLAASFNSSSLGNGIYDSRSDKYDDALDNNFHLDDSSSNSPGSTRSFGDTQLEIFHHQHGVLILHILATLMFVPSLVAWFQRVGSVQSLPWLLDVVLCVGLILHGVCNSKLESAYYPLTLPGMRGREIRPSLVYMVAGCFTFICSLAAAPYRAFYAMASIGVMSSVLRMAQIWNREKGEAYMRSKRHSHRH
uniref:GPI inositol-deacylase n=1 Tax=Kalanchoe fedtschenkoi TaxID=63787 RepID=A0A7N0T4W6_KALFE